MTLEDFLAVSVEEAQEQLMQVGVEHCWVEQVAKVAIQKKRIFDDLDRKLKDIKEIKEY